ncbi:MAG TPA: sulfotransferase [Sphingomicrobium sp.]|nr:sulfotransferase [Sphingomicrobium sp.]
MLGSTALDPRTASAIREALASASNGRIADARRIGEAALAAGGDEAPLNAMLGTFCLRSADFEGAARHLRIAHAMRPDDVTIAINLGTALAQLELYQEALAVASEELAAADQSLRLQRLRAFAAQSLGQHASAIAAYERIVAVSPTDWESWNNLGNSRRCAGDADGAVEALRRAAALAPDAPPVRLNFANALVEVGKEAEAEAEFRSMAKDFPAEWRALRELHVLLRSQAREEEALAAIEEASRRNPEDLELLLGVASQRLLLLDNPGAEAAYRKVVERDSRNPLGNLGLAVVYDLSNRTDDLARLVEDVQSRNVDEGVRNFIRAFDHRRAKRFEEGLVAMTGVSNDLEPARQADLLGQLNDRAGKYDEAWRAFSALNQIQREDASRPVERGARYREAMRKNFEATTPEWAERWVDHEIGDKSANPIFLVGFPRSGTTLLDTFLMGHPATAVLEEEPILNSAAALIGDYDGIPETPPQIIRAARDIYWVEAAKRLETNKLVVDKNPLFVGAMPLIRRIFPQAKIILAVRHPCDVVLSCFTTNFRLNDAMSNFLGLDTTAELYDLAFSYFDRMQSLLPMNTHVVKYEQFVADREGELKNLFDFLELPWSDRVLDHEKTAMNRGLIKTASYAQVVEPVYARSMGRWKNYEKHLAPILPVLKPWIEKFGYDA